MCGLGRFGASPKADLATSPLQESSLAPFRSLSRSSPPVHPDPPTSKAAFPRLFAPLPSANHPAVLGFPPRPPSLHFLPPSSAQVVSHATSRSRHAKHSTVHPPPFSSLPSSCRLLHRLLGSFASSCRLLVPSAPPHLFVRDPCPKRTLRNSHQNTSDGLNTHCRHSNRLLDRFCRLRGPPRHATETENALISTSP